LSSLLTFLQGLLGNGKYHETTKELEVFCPFCSHHKKKLSINVETQHWQCWVCGKNGKWLLYVVKKTGSKNDVLEYLRKYKAKNVLLKDVNYEDLNLSLPPEFVPLISVAKSALGKRAINYLTQKRGVELGDILRHKIGTATAGPYFGKIIFPSFSADGALNYFTARSIDTGRYMNPLDLPRYYKNSIVINDLNIDWKKPVVLVEGFMDMLKSVPNTIPLCGSSLVEDSLLFEKIVLSGAPVYLSLDSDAKHKSWKIADMLMGYGVSVYFVDLLGYSDVGETSKEQYRNLFAGAKSIDERFLFKQRLSALC